MNKTPPHLLPPLVFAAGLAVVAWIGIGYLGAHPVALAVTLLIGTLYLAGALELHRYRQATTGLERALDGLETPPPALADWLAPLHPSLRNAVRLRVEGERATLPAPTLTPYLVGMLVLLGMLGTLLGMVLTLRGTGVALQTTTDLAAIRDSLAAPVTGLGVAFGTSIAGVAASAMLGLLSALCRRERIGAVQRLDAHIASTLRPHSHAHRREEAFRLVQRQADALPALVERLDAMMDAIERRAERAHAQQAEREADFHGRTERAYVQLAESVERSLQRSAADSARVAGQALQPTVEATMAALARESGSLRSDVREAVQRQLDALDTALSGTAARAADAWLQAVDGQREANAAQATDLRAALDAFATRFAERSDALAADFSERSGALVTGIGERLDATAVRLGAAWDAALDRQRAEHAALAERHGQALDAATERFGAQAGQLLEGAGAAHARLQQALAEQDAQRLEAWRGALTETGADLRGEWTRIGEDAAARQQAICDALAGTADRIAEQTQAHAGRTIAEISALVEAASEAPRAAAEVIAELRQKLSDSMVRDTAVLEERTQLLGTLDTLLDAVNHASSEQRGAIDALVSTSADLLDRVGTRFGEHVATETGKLDGAAARIDLGAAEVASLGEAFAGAVTQFGDTSGQLMARLEAIEGALERAQARSDEQMAYYVAQAREVVDLSLLAQKQILQDLQRAGGRDGDRAEAA